MKNSFKTPLVPISWGELIDKITILEVKLKKLNTPSALLNVKNEYEYFQQNITENIFEDITNNNNNNNYKYLTSNNACALFNFKNFFLVCL